MIVIYAIYRKSNDECVYVGQSKNIEVRCATHLKNKEKFNDDGYFYECLESFDFYDLNMLLDREAYWINKMEPTFNIIRDRSMPDSVKLKVSESQKCLPETEYCKKHKTLMRLQRQKEKKKLQYYYDFLGNRIYF